MRRPAASQLKPAEGTPRGRPNPRRFCKSLKNNSSKPTMRRALGVLLGVLIAAGVFAALDLFGGCLSVPGGVVPNAAVGSAVGILWAIYLIRSAGKARR